MSKKQSVFMKILRFFLIVVLLPIVLIFLIVNFVKKVRTKKREKELIKVYNITQIDTLSGIEFEMLLKNLFEKMGCAVSLTKTTSDFGADLILKRKGKRCIVQAKRYSGTVGVSAVQEVVSAKSHYKSANAMVVTNSTFSSEAKVLAGECGVDLVDRGLLEKLIAKYDVKITQLKRQNTTLLDSPKSDIISKYKYWI